MSQLLETVELTTLSSQVPQHAIIWLHGLGANGHDFESIVDEFTELQKRHACRFIFPHAPVIPVSINGGMPMPAWFDVHSLDWDADWDEAGMQQSISQVNALIAEEIARGIPAERIFLVGFSQGGAVAMLTGLTHQASLAGLMGLSTFLPLTEKIKRQFTTANISTPIFLAHGKQDSVVDFAFGQRTHALLEKTHANLTWQAYPNLQHSVHAQEIQDIEAWLIQRIEA